MRLPKVVALSLLSVSPTFAGTPATETVRYEEPAAPNPWSFFLGGSATYLFEYEEPMLSLNAGVTTPWSPMGFNTSIFAELGWIEDDNESQIPFGVFGAPVDLQIVPVTLNISFEKAITENFGFYLGVGGGIAFSEVIVDKAVRDQDNKFVGQAFAGVNFRLSEQSEIYAGGRWMYFDDTENFNLAHSWGAELGYRWRF